MPLHAATIFLSAFLLFLVQPILAKQILPWFGGAAIVWTMCMVFFQFVLLLGYAYAHWLASRPNPRRQALDPHRAAGGEPRVPADRAGRGLEARRRRQPRGAHPRPALRHRRPALLPAVVDEPAGAGLVRARLIRVPAPTACSRSRTSPRCWRCWAIRSCSSPGSPTRNSRPYWSMGYACFVIALRRARVEVPHARAPARGSWCHARCRAGACAPRPRASRSGSRSPPWARSRSCGVTNHLTQNISSIPLLWVIPLAVYLLTFILCFEGRGWYRRDIYLGFLVWILCVMAWFLADKGLQFELLWHVARVHAGPLLRLHVLPRRARAPAPRPEAPHALLSRWCRWAGVIGGVLVGHRRAGHAARLPRARDRAGGGGGPRAHRESQAGRLVVRRHAGRGGGLHLRRRSSTACTRSWRTRSTSSATTTACCA